MATLKQVRDGLATNLSSLTSSMQVYRFRPKDPKFPCAMIGWPDALDLSPAQDGVTRSITLEVAVAVVWGDDESTNDSLSTLFESTAAALLSDRTLGGSVGDIWLGAATFPLVSADDGRTWQECRIPVTVYA